MHESSRRRSIAAGQVATHERIVRAPSGSWIGSCVRRFADHALPFGTADAPGVIGARETHTEQDSSPA
jgi:hypothetical protein